MKKLFVILLVIGLGIFVSMGCVTKDLWRERGIKIYTDTIISFYSSHQKSEIIFIGTKYHYIFNKGTAPLQEVLKAKDFLALNKSNLNIRTETEKDNPSVVYTTLEIYFEEQRLTTQQKSWLNNHGFNRYTNYVPMRKKIFQLQGQRYTANSQVNDKAIKLKKPISIHVNVHSDNTLYKILMTPLTVTADAGLALAGAIILPIIWITN